MNNYVLTGMNTNYANTIKNVVASFEGFILFIKLDYFFLQVFFFILIYDKQIIVCITLTQ